MLCALILYVSGGTYSLTSTPNDRFLRNFFMAIWFTLRAFARNLLRGSRRRNIFHISFFIFFFYDWPGIRTKAFASNKPTHYILDHGDFMILLSIIIPTTVSKCLVFTICNCLNSIRWPAPMTPHISNYQTPQELFSRM